MAKGHLSRAMLNGPEAVPVTLLRSKVVDESVADRVDGASGLGDLRLKRNRSGSTEPLALSKIQFLEKVARGEFLWREADYLEELATHGGRGRPRECRAGDILLLNIAATRYGSLRAAARELRDPQNWARLQTATQIAWPENPEWRLSTKAPTRSQYNYFRKTVIELDDLIDDLRGMGRDSSIAAGEAVGLFDPSKGSFSRPATTNMPVGDGSWIQSMYNVPGGVQLIDKETGEIIRRRSDPDSVPYHTDGQACGVMMVSITARNPFGNERLLIDVDFKTELGKGDGTIGTDMVADIATRTFVGGYVHDMAIKAADRHRCLKLGVLPFSRVPLTKSGTLQYWNGGEHSFKLTNRTAEQIKIVAVDGRPGIEIPSAEGVLWQPLERKQLYKRGKFGFYRVYGKWVVPDVATAPVRLRGATVDIRHDSTDEEVATGKYRERGLYAVPPADPDFDRCYNIREDVESWHHYLKSQLPNRRARSVGIRRQRFDMHALQLALITTTLLAWHERTGGDLQPWFGQSRPPNQDHATAA